MQPMASLLLWRRSLRCPNDGICLSLYYAFLPRINASCNPTITACSSTIDNSLGVFDVWMLERGILKFALGWQSPCNLLGCLVGITRLMSLSLWVFGSLKMNVWSNYHSLDKLQNDVEAYNLRRVLVRSMALKLAICSICLLGTPMCVILRTLLNMIRM